MAVIAITHHPELTPESARDVFQRHFSPRYVVYKTGISKRDFVVKKSGWTAKCGPNVARRFTTRQHVALVRGRGQRACLPSRLRGPTHGPSGSSSSTPNVAFTSTCSSGRKAVGKSLEA